MFVDIFKQVIILLVYVFIGIALKKSKALPENSEAVVSKLETNLFLPAYVFLSYATNIRIENIKQYPVSIFYGSVFVGIAFCLGCVFSVFFAEKGKLRNIHKYLFTVPNYGYFGYPFVEGVFGGKMRTDMMMFCLPLSIFTYTVGVYLLQSKKNPGKGFGIHPIFLFSLCGFLSGIFSLEFPAEVTKILTSLSSCMSPLAMILLGLTIASAPISKLFCNIKPYIVSLIRLICIPIIIGFIFRLIGVRGSMLIIPVFVSAMPIGMNVVVFLQDNDRNTHLGAQYCFISVLLCAVTIPLIYLIMNKLGLC